MENFFEKLERSLAELSSVVELKLNGHTIDLNDIEQMTHLFWKNQISEKDLPFENLANFCVQVIKLAETQPRDSIKTLISWCLAKLFEGGSAQMDTNKSIFEQNLLNEYLVLTTWFLRHLFHVAPHHASDSFLEQNAFHAVHGEYDYSKFQQILDNNAYAASDSIPPSVLFTKLYEYLLPNASRVDTHMVLTGKSFYPVYEEKIIYNDNLSYPSDCKRFTQLEKKWQKHTEASQALNSLLVDYVKFTHVLGSLHRERFFRFFAGAWNQHHVETVRGLLIANSLGAEPDFTSPSFSCAHLLEGLRNRLLRAGKTLNLNGTLAQIISFAQTKLNIYPIDIEELNKVILKNIKNGVVHHLPLQPSEICLSQMSNPWELS